MKQLLDGIAKGIISLFIGVIIGSLGILFYENLVFGIFLACCGVVLWAIARLGTD